MQEAVEEGCGDGGVAEDLAPVNWNWLRFLITHLGFDLRTYVVGVSG